jgi:hypothetical protein
MRVYNRHVSSQIFVWLESKLLLIESSRAIIRFIAPMMGPEIAPETDMAGSPGVLY